MNWYTNAIYPEEATPQQEERVKARGALMPEELDAAKQKAISWIGSENKVDIVDHRMEPNDYYMLLESGKDVTNIYLRRGIATNDCGFGSNNYVIRKCEIMRVIGSIIELNHGLTCTITDFALWLRNGAAIRSWRINR